MVGFRASALRKVSWSSEQVGIHALAAAAALVVGAALLTGAMSVGQPTAAAPQAPAAAPRGPTYISRIMVYDLTRKSSTLVHQADGIWEAPNWSRQGNYLLVNSQGKLYRIAADGRSAPEAISLDPTLRANNDHDLSADGQLLALLRNPAQASQKSQVFVSNADGSEVRLVTPAAPSYFHGWSPDSRLSGVRGRRAAAMAGMSSTGCRHGRGR